MYLCISCILEDHEACEGTTFIERPGLEGGTIYEVECDCEEHGCAVRGID